MPGYYIDWHGRRQDIFPGGNIVDIFQGVSQKNYSSWGPTVMKFRCNNSSKLKENIFLLKVNRKTSNFKIQAPCHPPFRRPRGLTTFSWTHCVGLCVWLRCSWSMSNAFTGKVQRYLLPFTWSSVLCNCLCSGFTSKTTTVWKPMFQ